MAVAYFKVLHLPQATEEKHDNLSHHSRSQVNIIEPGTSRIPSRIATFGFLEKLMKEKISGNLNLLKELQKLSFREVIL